MDTSEFGVIFDWDGVVVDSSAPHERAWERFASEEGLALPENHLVQSFGMKNRAIMMDLFGWTQDPFKADEMGNRKEALFREIITREGMQPLPGVAALLRDLKACGVPCVVGSSAPRENILCVVDRLGFAPYFDHIISAEDVNRGKPDPEVFLKAADASGHKASHCVVIEDALVGVEAALAAGAAVLAVTTTCPASDLETAHRVVDSLESIRASDLEKLVQRRS